MEALRARPRRPTGTVSTSRGGGGGCLRALERMQSHPCIPRRRSGVPWTWPGLPAVGGGAPAGRAAAVCGRRRCGCRCRCRHRGSVPAPPTRPWRSRSTAAAAGAAPAPPPPPAVGCRRGARGRAWVGARPTGVGESPPCRPPPGDLVPAGSHPASASSVAHGGCAPAGGLWRPPGWPPVPQRLQPHPTPWQGRRGGGHHPAGRGAAAPVWRTARRPRRRSGRASARARRPQRRAAAAVATRASAHRRGRLGVGAAPRSVPLPTTAPVRGVSGVPVAARGWQHVVTGGRGGVDARRGRPVASPPVWAVGCGGGATVVGSRGGRVAVCVRKGWTDVEAIVTQRPLRMGRKPVSVRQTIAPVRRTFPQGLLPALDVMTPCWLFRGVKIV